MEIDLSNDKLIESYQEILKTLENNINIHNNIVQLQEIRLNLINTIQELESKNLGIIKIKDLKDE